MPRLRIDPFFQNFRKQTGILVSLVRHPEETWASLRNTVADWRDVYYFLIFPLCGLLGAVTFVNELPYDGAVSAGIYFLLETGFALATVVISATLIFYLATLMKGDASHSWVHASAPYIFVFWLVAGIAAGVLSAMLPVLAGPANYLLYLGSLLAGGYFLYFYSEYYLGIPQPGRMLFFVPATLGIIVLSLFLYRIKTELVYSFIVRGY